MKVKLYTLYTFIIPPLLSLCLKRKSAGTVPASVTFSSVRALFAPVDCRCVHGVCDNRPGGMGVCRRGSCQEGFSGELCDQTTTPCNSDGVLEHCHIHAKCVYHNDQTMLVSL